MKDRVVQFPHRYQLVPVAGQDSTYDFIPVPGTITEQGTPLNKATLLSDAVAALYGLSGDDATVDNALLSGYSKNNVYNATLLSNLAYSSPTYAYISVLEVQLPKGKYCVFANGQGSTGASRGLNFGIRKQSQSAGETIVNANMPSYFTGATETSCSLSCIIDIADTQETVSLVVKGKSQTTGTVYATNTNLIAVKIG